MPCYQQRQVTVKLNAANAALFKAGVARDGLRLNERSPTVSYISDGYTQVRIENGEAIGNEGAATNALINRIKRAYSREVLRQVPQGAGWVTRALDTDTTDVRRFVAKRRY